MKLLLKVEKTIREHDMIRPGERVLVALSGGPDSVACLRCLQRLAGKWRIEIGAAYFNHRLRGPESREEEAFVGGLCRRLGVPLSTKRMDPRRLKKGTETNLEAFCREERYRFLAAAREKLGYDKIALGHNRSDQAETVLMHLLRGSGLGGMKGMLPVRDGVYIRPILEATRKEILLFLQEEKLDYVLDSTNASEAFHRNRIRHHLIGEILVTYNPRVEENIAQLARIIADENDYINSVVDGLIEAWGLGGDRTACRVKIEKLEGLHPALRKRVILGLLQRLARKGAEIGHVHVEAVQGLITAGRTGKALDLPGEIRVCREYGMLVMARGRRTGSSPRKNGRASRPQGDYSYDVRVPGAVGVAEAGRRLSFDFVGAGDARFDCGKRVYMDYDRIVLPVVVRNVRTGDRIQPLGMKGHKKVKSLFIDEKIARDERDRLPVVADRKSVLWVPGLRMSERVRIRPGTETVLKIEIN
jgi:tRNA(Ile)-lysidine synthase